MTTAPPEPNCCVRISCRFWKPLPRSFAVGTCGLTDVLARGAFLVVAEEEDLVPEDRTAARGSELVKAKFALVRGCGVVLEPIGGIHFVVAEELPNVAMDRVCTGFHSGIEDLPRQRHGRAQRYSRWSAL